MDELTPEQMKALVMAIQKKLRSRGIDPAEATEKQLSDALDDVRPQFDFKIGDKVHMKGPAPSQEAVDSWWKQYGGVIVGGGIAIVAAIGTILAQGGGGNGNRSA